MLFKRIPKNSFNTTLLSVRLIILLKIRQNSPLDFHRAIVLHWHYHVKIWLRKSVELSILWSYADFVTNILYHFVKIWKYRTYIQKISQTVNCMNFGFLHNSLYAKASASRNCAFDGHLFGI